MVVNVSQVTTLLKNTVLVTTQLFTSITIWAISRVTLNKQVPTSFKTYVYITLVSTH